ncbi:centrosomal protein of 162 kDa [Lampris incognitus]|uniref:centrosomal protein of 162 kDa n=1 Tax=Lampris incognitus TaxID=2546036 RepID=UPI0024B5C8F8|nr:centrosomal protein of 162 kDa [Lampris incognitus]
MSYKLTQEELDEQFEQFMKESISDDSVDLVGPAKQRTVLESFGNTTQRQAKKPAISSVPWWQQDDDSPGGPGRAEKATKSRFIKLKKPKSENTEDETISVEPSYKPVPKPRSKALDRLVELDSTHKTNLEASQPLSRQTSSEDDSHAHRLLESRHTYRKSLKSQPIQEEEEEYSGDKGLSSEEKIESAILSKDSLEQEVSVMASGSALNTMSMVMNSLQEEEEKARFFAKLEAEASSTIDYSKLNRELDCTNSTIDTMHRNLEEDVEWADDEQRQGEVMETEKISPDSPHYSEDFEDEGSCKEPLVTNAERSPMLAKVSLYDSLDSTGGVSFPEENKKVDVTGSKDKAQSYGQSGGSDMEALHEAYRQISWLDGSEDNHSQQFSMEKRERRSRFISPSSPPEPSRGTLKPASTTESELPTAEELMRPIRPERDQIRGSTYQSVRSFERTSPESSPKQLAKPNPAVGTREYKGSTTPPSPDLPLQELSLSIRDQVERLMQDQDSCLPGAFTQDSEAKILALHDSISGPSTSLVRNPVVTLGKKGARRLTVASQLSGSYRSTVKAKSYPLTQKKPPRHALQPSLKPTEECEENDDCTHTGPGVKVSLELIASVQSSAAGLQHQIDSSGLSHTPVTQEGKYLQETEKQHLVEDGREPWGKRQVEDESSVGDKLKVQLAQDDKELHFSMEQLLQQHKEELSSLRQQNYILQSKLRNAEYTSQKRRWGDATDPVTEERLKLIEKEMQEQETLIQGYHQENEKLYQQMKAQEAKSKGNEEILFTENQRLLNELALAQGNLNKTWRKVGNACPMDHTKHITELLDQMHTIKKNEAMLLEETDRLRQEKRVIEVDLQLMKKERDFAKAQVASTSGDRSLEMRLQEDRHREEVGTLRKKLQWYAENQELLDRDASRLRAATAETHNLKEQVEKLKMEVGKRGNQPQNKVNKRVADIKRIQDLERQVKELKQILVHRRPSSLPALIYAAASACEPAAQDTTKTSTPTCVVALLERRIQRLEAELESCDEEARRSLRTMEQQFQRIKLRYEEQISELEHHLNQKQQLEAPGSTVPSEAWENKLKLVEEAHQKTEKALQEQILSLEQQLAQKVQPTKPPQRVQSSPTRHQRQTDTAFGVRIDRLNQELAAKTRTIQELTRTVDRLQKEKNISSNPCPRQGDPHGDTKQQAVPSKKGLLVHPGERCGEAATFPATQQEKTYQPTAFTGSHITEVLQENEVLKERLGQLAIQKEQEKVALQTAAAQSQAELCRLKESVTEQLSSLKAEHQKELDSLNASHALENSSSKVAELTSRVNTQEIMLQHLRDQVKELHEAKDSLAVSKIREETLQNQLTRLLEELKQAKEAYSPELKHFCSLEKKIFDMELRHSQREKELQKVIRQTRQVVEAEQQSEVNHWRCLAQRKSRELEAFRQELDSILDILRDLHRQGVVLPCPGRPLNVPFTWRS